MADDDLGPDGIGGGLLDELALPGGEFVLVQASEGGVPEHDH